MNKLNNKSSKTSSNNNNKYSDGQPQTITIDSTSIKQIIKEGTTSYTFKID
ncbi:hypothetical protein [Aurantibacter sp.]|uniref:hypothetical protein n=1 Tax=Aurantibacter sp. TaxID=2807103 RepID=UPI0035C84834